MGIKCLYTQSPVLNFYRKDYSTYKLEILNPQKINLLDACRLLPTRWINTIEMYSLIVPEASILTSRYPQDHAASKGSKEDSFLSLCIFWLVHSNPWHSLSLSTYHTNLPLSSHCLPPMCIYVFSSSYKDNSHWIQSPLNSV